MESRIEARPIEQRNDYADQWLYLLAGHVHINEVTNSEDAA